MKQLGLKNLQKRQAFSRSIELVEVYLGTSIMLKRDVAAGKTKTKNKAKVHFVHRFVHCPPILFLED